MSLPRYEEYKDSGIPWLGEIPVHWTVCALKRVTLLKSGENITSEKIEEAGEYPVYGGNGLRGFTSSFTHEGHFVLIGRQGALCGNVNYSAGKFWASEHAVVARPAQPVDTIWLGEMLRAMNLNQYSVSAAQPGLSVELISNIGVPYPSLDEQRAIGAFLDRETAKIDVLIAEQEKLVALLAEKRQAVISHAVTKGLDPNAPVKDSGIPWLGEVPAHWNVLAIKRLSSSIEQGWSPQCENYPVESTAEWGVLKVGCVNGGVFAATENKKLPDELEPISEYSLKKGDLLVSRANTRDLVGSAAVVLEDWPRLLLCDKLYRLRMDGKKCDPRFVSAFLNSPGVRSEIEVSATGASSSMQNIGQATVLEMPMAVPPCAEQEAIMHFVASESERLNKLRHEVERGLDLLKERRSALIGAAVTGQIDVRGVVEVQPA